MRSADDLARLVDQRLRDRPFARLDGEDFDIHAMTIEMGGDVDRRFALAALPIHHHDARVRRALQERQGLGDRPRQLARILPGDDDGVCFFPRLGARRHRIDRMPGAEQGRFKQVVGDGRVAASIGRARDEQVRPSRLRDAQPRNIAGLRRKAADLVGRVDPGGSAP